MEQRRLYPIGIQTFSKLREGNYVYVDKTELVYRMTHGASSYIFLSRPRRFGKSLLTSTLRSYFEGRKELFEGLAIEKLEKEWKSYPVLHFDMSLGKHLDREGLEHYLGRRLSEWESIYGRDENALMVNDRELLSIVERSMNTHLEFMLPDGAWDNSWGTRSFKWTYWGGRTSDGFMGGYYAMACASSGVPGGYSPQYTITEKIDG